MKSRKPFVGFCPIGKFVFSNEDAIKYKTLLQSKLDEWEVPYADLEGVLEDGLVKDQKHVDPAVNHFKKHGVDCIFMPHCNFGTEGAVGMIAKKLGLPVLLWGPRDEAPLPSGHRLRDTLCGLFASSKVLHRLDIPFTYIENCRLDDDAFRVGFDRFLRAANVANVFRKGARIGMIGQRIDFFWTTIINESELLQRFNIEIQPFDMAEFIEAVRKRVEANRPGYLQEAGKLRETCTLEGLDDPVLANVLAVRDEILDLREEYGLDGVALRTFMSIIDAMGAYCSYSESEVSSELPLGMENDIHGAISDLLLRRANFNQTPAHLSEFTVRHPENENGVLLWHAGTPLSMAHPDARVVLGHHWILPSKLSGMTHFRLKDGPITITRFDGDQNGYQLAIGEGKSIEGPKTLNNYVWMEVDDWPRWERTMMEGPWIHHVAMNYGHYGDALQEACKFIPHLEPVRLDRKDGDNH